MNSAAEAAAKDTEAMAGDEGMAEARYSELETCAARIEDHPVASSPRIETYEQDTPNSKSGRIPQTPRCSFDGFPWMPYHLKPQEQGRFESPTRGGDDDESVRNTVYEVARIAKTAP